MSRARTPPVRRVVAPLLPLPLVLPLVLSLGGCLAANPFRADPSGVTPADGDFVTSQPVTVPEFDFLWERAKFTLQTDGYGIDSVRTRRDKREMTSWWKTLLAPSRYKGVRRRVVIRFTDHDVAAGSYLVHLAVQAQTNTDMNAPMDSSSAVWEVVPADVERANVLLYRIEAGFAD